MLSSILPFPNAQLLKTTSYISVQSIFRLFITITFFLLSTFMIQFHFLPFSFPVSTPAAQNQQGYKHASGSCLFKFCSLCLRTLSRLTSELPLCLGRFMVGPLAAKRCQITLLCSKDIQYSDQCLQTCHPLKKKRLHLHQCSICLAS